MDVRLNMTFEEFVTELNKHYDQIKGEPISTVFHALVRPELPLDEVYAYILAGGGYGVTRRAIENALSISEKQATQVIVALKRAGSIIRSEQTGRRNGRWVAVECLTPSDTAHDGLETVNLDVFGEQT